MRTESASRLALGLLTGVAFGTLLQKGRAAKYQAIHDQLRLRDQSIRRIMGTAVAVGSAAVQLLLSRGLAQRHVKPLHPVGVVAGAGLFGAGMALLGYCPGTTVAAVAEGNRDALAGLAGMFSGAALFTVAYPRMKPLIERGSKGEVTLPQSTRTSPWLWVAGTGAATLADYYLSRSSWHSATA